jgi:hypothetical protein
MASRSWARRARPHCSCRSTSSRRFSRLRLRTSARLFSSC